MKAAVFSLTVKIPSAVDSRFQTLVDLTTLPDIKLHIKQDAESEYISDVEVNGEFEWDRYLYVPEQNQAIYNWVMANSHDLADAAKQAAFSYWTANN